MSIRIEASVETIAHGRWTDMLDRSRTRRIALAAAAGGVALALASAPVALDQDGLGFAPKAVFAKSGGDKGGNANANGHDKGKKGGLDGLSASTKTYLTPEEDSHGKAHKGNGNGHFKDKDAVSGVEGFHEGEDHEKVKSLLGSLNAAHAIANGNTNTNPNSRVGRVREYMEAFNDYAAGEPTTVDVVADALLAASNKDLETMETDTVEEVVGGVNELLGDDITATEPDLGDAERDVAEEISPPI
jgi:hypothetical protein